ncbi:MAG: hypothetical protein AMS22_11590 [Thiotrichales bacterium SG8_50]|nr:MAG: hypothetical protein AMS22_11590 [Thiotrichales bacterium SG8_50]
MRKLLTLLLTLGLVISFTQMAPSNPIPVPMYDWEDGGTVLALYGSGDPPIIATNVGAPDPVFAGLSSLRLEDNSPSGTPQAYIAFLWNLQDGDFISAGFWRYDMTPDAAPSCRIWAHWNDELPGNPDGYNGSAGGNSDYGLGEGWDYTWWDWEVVDGHTGLVIEARTYSELGDTVWIDDLDILAPDHVYIQFPGNGPIATETKTWGNIKTLYSD